MTLFEPVFILVIILGGAISGAVATKYWGPYFGILAGFVGLFLPPALAFGVYYILDRRFRNRPVYPMCENGVCKSDDYKIVEGSDNKSYCVCKCCKKYTLWGARFYRVCDDGHLEPYKVQTLGGGWEDDV